MHPVFARLRPTLLIAHRGGAALAPENTMEAFRLAVERHGADMIETDVQTTRDGELVLVHDALLDRTTDGEGAVCALTLSELLRLDAGHRFSPDGGRTFPHRGTGMKIPRLVELLRAFPGLLLNVELKPAAAGHEEALASLLREEGAAGRVCLGSEEDEVAARLVAAMPDGCHFYPRGALFQIVLHLRGATERAPDDPYRVLDMPLEFQGVRLVDRALVERAAALGLWVNVWTIDDPAEMERLIAEGVGGIMTDRPDLLRHVLDAQG